MLLHAGICRGKKKNAQEGHGAVAPVDPMIVPEEIFTHMQKVKRATPTPSELTMGQKKLYELIWRRTLASQMAPSKLSQVSLNFMVFRSGFTDYTELNSAIVTQYGCEDVGRHQICHDLEPAMMDFGMGSFLYLTHDSFIMRCVSQCITHAFWHFTLCVGTTMACDHSIMQRCLIVSYHILCD